KAASAALRHSGPAHRPRYGASSGTRPALGFSVDNPSQVPGKRIEPPISLPTCSGPYPAAAAAPAPALDPPVVSERSHGLRVMPCRLDTPEDSIPQSGITVDPRTTAPDSSARSVIGALPAGSTGSTPALPDRIGTPARPMFS